MEVCANVPRRIGTVFGRVVRALAAAHVTDAGWSIVSAIFFKNFIQHGGKKRSVMASEW